MLYMSLFYPNSPIFGAKPLPRRRFLQHYYRNTFIESHQKPIVRPADVLVSTLPLQGKNADNRKNTPTKYENRAEKTPTKHTMTCIYTFFLLPLRRESNHPRKQSHH